MKKLEIQVKSNCLEEIIEFSSDYKNELNVFVNGVKEYSQENRKTVYGIHQFVHGSKLYILSIDEGAMVPIGNVNIDGKDVDFEIISCDSLIDDFRNSLVDTQYLAQTFLSFGILAFVYHSNSLFGSIEMTSNRWLFMVLGILSIVSGIGLKKKKVWSWWLASITNITFCLFVIESAIEGISTLNILYGLFLIPLLILNKKCILFQFNLEKVSSIWRIVTPSLFSLIGLYVMIWS